MFAADDELAAAVALPADHEERVQPIGPTLTRPPVLPGGHADALNSPTACVLPVTLAEQSDVMWTPPSAGGFATPASMAPPAGEGIADKEVDALSLAESMIPAGFAVQPTVLWTPPSTGRQKVLADHEEQVNLAAELDAAGFTGHSAVTWTPPSTGRTKVQRLIDLYSVPSSAGSMASTSSAPPELLFIFYKARVPAGGFD